MGPGARGWRRRPGRRSLDVLRVVARVRDAFHAAADASSGSSAATAAEPSAGVWVRRAARTVVAIAAVEVAATLVLLGWVWDDFHREYGELAVYLGRRADRECSERVRVAAGDTPATGGRRCSRPISCSTRRWCNPPVLLALLWGMDPRELFGYPWVYPFLFAPAFLWAFARACPRVHRRTRPGRPCPSHGHGLRDGRLRALDRDGRGTGIARGPATWPRRCSGWSSMARSPS